MSQWDVLLMLNAVMPMTGAVREAHERQSGWMGYCLAIVLGIVLATISVWALLRLGRSGKLALDSMAAEDSRTPWPLRLAYWAAIVWPFVTLFGSGWLAKAVLKML